jgi:hypothetical protein
MNKLSLVALILGSASICLSVSCLPGTAQYMIDQELKALDDDDYKFHIPRNDLNFKFTHPFGCSNKFANEAYRALNTFRDERYELIIKFLETVQNGWSLDDIRKKLVIEHEKAIETSNVVSEAIKKLCPGGMTENEVPGAVAFFKNILWARLNKLESGYQISFTLRVSIE